jgi:hypothetical protein
MANIASRVKSIWIEYLKSIRHEPGDTVSLSSQNRHSIGSNVSENTHQEDFERGAFSGLADLSSKLWPR